MGVVWGKVEESGFGRAVSCCGTGVRLSRQALDALTVTPEPNENGGSLSFEEVREAARVLSPFSLCFGTDGLRAPGCVQQRGDWLAGQAAGKGRLWVDEALRACGL